METTNAHTPGHGLGGGVNATGLGEGSHVGRFARQSREGPDVSDPTDTKKLIAALRVAYGDSTWVDLPRLSAEYVDPNTDPSDTARFYLNRLVAAGGQLVNVSAWDLRASGEQLRPGDTVALGFDGARFWDSTALVAVRIDDGFTSIVNLWERPEGVDQWRSTLTRSTGR